MIIVQKNVRVLLLRFLINSALVLRHMYQQRAVGFPPPGGVPYMPPEEVAFFTKTLEHCRGYVEFGSGGSTVYASRLGVPTISVENDAFYARSVKSQLTGHSVIQVVTSLGPSMAWGMPAFPRVKLARRYVMAPWTSENFPDFVLVDGRYRVACALTTAHEAFRRGVRVTLMFDDYVERPSYHPVEELLGQPPLIGRAAVFAVGEQHVPIEEIERWLRDPG